MVGQDTQQCEGPLHHLDPRRIFRHWIFRSWTFPGRVMVLVLLVLILGIGLALTPRRKVRIVDFIFHSADSMA